MNKLTEFFESAKTVDGNSKVYCKLFIYSPNSKEGQLEPVLTGTYNTSENLIVDINALPIERELKDFIVTNLNDKEISAILYQNIKKDISEIAGSLQLQQDDRIVELFAKYDIFY
jgi:hypothetical protein